MEKNRETFGLSLATILGLNAVIGAGIFGVPAAFACTAGPSGLLAYVFVILAVLSIAFAIGKMSFLYPTTSMFYDYAALWAGKWGGIISTCLYAGGLVTALGLLSRIAGGILAKYFTFASPVVLGCILAGGITLICLTGTRAAKAWQIFLIIFTILPLLLITVLCGTRINFENLHPFAPNGISGAISSIKFIVFGFFGFEAIPSLFTKIHDPQKNVPRAITLTIIITGIIYLAFSTAVLLAVPASIFTSPSLPISDVLLNLFPGYTWLIFGIDWSIVIIIAGTLHSMLLAVSSLISNMGSHLTKNKRAFSSAATIITTGTIVMICCGFLTQISLLFSLTAVGITAAFMAIIIPLLTGTKSHPERYLATAGIAIAACTLLFGCGLVGIVEALK